MDYVDFAAELMKKMVSVPSESQNEEELALYLCEYLANIGMDCLLYTSCKCDMGDQV